MRKKVAMAYFEVLSQYLEGLKKATIQLHDSQSVGKVSPSGSP
jgi:hypothetical protein